MPDSSAQPFAFMQGNLTTQEKLHYGLPLNEADLNNQLSLRLSDAQDEAAKLRVALREYNSIRIDAVNKYNKLRRKVTLLARDLLLEDV